MNSQILKGILSEEIPKYEEFSADEKLPPLDYNLIINGISSIPLYERLDIKKESLCEEELKLMNLQAKRYDACYKQKIKKTIQEEKLKVYDEELKNCELECKDDEENVEIFLKYIYNNSENAGLITELMKKMSSDGVLQDSSSKVHPFDEDKTCTPSKEFSEFLLKTNEGIHDDFVIRETLSSHDTGSELSSEEKDEVSENIAKKLSCKLKFSDSTNTEFLEHIINAKKPDMFKLIAESSSKRPVLQAQHLFRSESESENEVDLQKKTKKTKDDVTSKEQLLNRGKKGKRSRRKIKPKLETKEGNKYLKKCTETKFEHLKNPKEKNSHDHFPVESCSNIKGLNQTKITEDRVGRETCFERVVASSSVTVPTEQLSIIKDSFPKNIALPKIKNDTSDSSDEDWKRLAEKSLLFRSRKIEQKAAKKK